MIKKIELELEFPEDFMPPEEFEEPTGSGRRYDTKCDPCPFYVWYDDYAYGDCTLPAVGCDGKCPLKKFFTEPTT